MKVGDLVRYSEGDYAEVNLDTVVNHLGTIMGESPTQHEVFWHSTNKSGWWDETKLEVIDEVWLIKHTLEVIR